MGEAQLKLSFGVPDAEAKRSPNRRLLTLQVILDWIGRMNLDPATREALAAKAKRFPANALPEFQRNLPRILQKIRQDRKRLQQGDGQDDPAEEYVEGEAEVETQRERRPGFERVEISATDLWGDDPGEDPGEDGGSEVPADLQDDGGGVL